MPDSDPEYRLSPAAERDLEQIWLYSLEQWGLSQANDYTDDLLAAFERLAENPQHGQRIDHIRPGYRRSRARRHTIYYRITDYGIAIIRVLHDRMLPLRHLPNGLDE